MDPVVLLTSVSALTQTQKPCRGRRNARDRIPTCSQETLEGKALALRVAVVGGGPAGSCAAETLVKAGIETYLIERKLDNAKPCGGAIPLCMVSEFDLPAEIIDRRVRNMKMISPSNREVNINLDNADEYIGMTRREVLDGFLRDRAAKLGTKLINGTLFRLELPKGELEDGRRIEGESQITEAGGRIVRLGVTPADLPALPRALEAIAAADYIIIGPGSLFTSIIPNLLVPAIAKALAESSAYRVYVCNIMTQPGETLGYTVADHIRAIDSVYPEPLFDAVLVQRQPPSEAAVQRYARQNSQPVEIDREAVLQLGRQVILANVMEEDPQNHCVRHQPTRLAAALMRWYRRSAN